jgi:hypothetical protein
MLTGTMFALQAQQAWATGCADDTAGTAAAAAAAAGKRRQLHLTVDCAEQLPAAEAVIAALYGVLDNLRNLQLQQLVNAVVIADRIGAPAVVEQAMSDLTYAVAAESPTVVVDALSTLPVWPACLQPVLLPVLQRAKLSEMPAAEVSKVQRMLLAVLGDLEAAWADSQLQKLLLQLPLPAMELLLSSDQLQVAAEDTVLYTAGAYVAAQQAQDQRDAAKAALAATVRAPHLSGSCLAAQAFSKVAGQLMSHYNEQLKLLASHKLATRGGAVPISALEHIPDVPAAWMLGTRQIVVSDGVRLVWRAPVELIAKGCRDSFADNKSIFISSPSSSPPIAGLSWQIVVECAQQERDGVRGTLVGVKTYAENAPDGMFCVYSCTLASGGISRHMSCGGSIHEEGFANFFTMDPMVDCGGWDEAAWAAKGLPTSGELEITLHMHSVGA